MTFWSDVDQELADEWQEEKNNLANAIKDIDNGNQLAQDFSTAELRKIINSSAATKQVIDECHNALKARKR